MMRLTTTGHRLRSQRRVARFVLTPLVDVIFLLIIFFMLSSQFAPYALLPLGDAAEVSEGEINEARSSEAGLGADLLIAVSQGLLRINGEPVDPQQAREWLARRHAEGARSAILLPRQSATVQDVVNVLEALRRTGFRAVTIRRGDAS
jgi:biopolymer transport protein ExbD